jgi:hypothetical protein
MKIKDESRLEHNDVHSVVCDVLGFSTVYSTAGICGVLHCVSVC